jgi:hypothetical protein
MKRLAAVLSFVAVALAGCATAPSGPGWVTLIDGNTGLENFNRLGDANWRAEGGSIVADRGKGGHLISKNTYKDFEMYVEFWADDTTNSGIFIRATDPAKITADNSYEVNIFDQRPGPEYATGAIVNFAKVPVPIVYRAGGRWNTFEITARGSQITVKFNGQQTVQMNDAKFLSGPFALQFGNGPKDAPGGPIKWRKVLIRPL